MNVMGVPSYAECHKYIATNQQANSYQYLIHTLSRVLSYLVFCITFEFRAVARATNYWARYVGIVRRREASKALRCFVTS